MENSKDKLEKIMKLALATEGQYNVSVWQIEGVHIWPIVKHTAFFGYKDMNDSQSKSKRISKIANKLWSLCKKRVSMFNKKNISELQQSDILFCGANAYYVSSLDKKRINKFFEPIKDCLKYSFIEINYSSSNFPNLASPVFNIYQLKFKKESESREEILFNHLKELLQTDNNLLKLFEEITKILDIDIIDFKKRFSKYLHTILVWKGKWIQVVEQTQPKVGMVLCYYDMCMYGLVLALKDKGIPSVDMQHGGQGVGHPAYSYSEKLNQDLNLLPDFFWVWDEVSQSNIEKWTKNISTKTILGGNPWIRYFAEQKTIDPIFPNRKLILCTLPADKSYYNLMPDYLLEALKKANSEYIFGFRFHPKTTGYGKQQFEKLINDNDLTSKVDLKLSNQLPLPYLFANAWGHISVGSIGSIAEAAIIGVKRNIILDSIGQQYYQKLIDENKAFYFDDNAGFDLMSFIENVKIDANKSSKKKYPSYNDLIKSISNA